MLPSVWDATFSQRLFIIMSSLALQSSRFEKWWTGIPIVLCDIQTLLGILKFKNKTKQKLKKGKNKTNKQTPRRDSPKNIQNFQN